MLVKIKLSIYTIIAVVISTFTAKATAPTWSVNPSGFQYNMTMVAVANLNCIELTNPSNRIGVFVGSQCRGTALTSQVVNGRYTASLFIYSNNVSGDTISFKVYNVVQDSVYNITSKVFFQQNANYGTSTAPYIVFNNQAPTDINLSANSFTENTAVNATVAILSASDPDAAETFSYTLVSGIGSTDNAKFTITGNSLKLASAVDYEIQKTCAIRLRVSDAGGCAYEKAFNLTVQNYNEPPTAIYISDSTIYENTPALTTIGSLYDIDPDSGDAAIFTLVSGTGSDDNASFNIIGSSIRSSQVFNYETKSSYSIRLRVRDAANNTWERPITILIKNINDAPTNIALSTTSVTENRATGSWIANFTAVDEDASDVFTYSFVNTTGNDNANFQIIGNQLRTNNQFDYETRQNYSIFVQVNDGNGGLFTKQFLLTVTDSNDTPTAISLSNNTLYENQATNTFIAKLTSSDPDAGQSNFTYALITGNGSTGNSNFTISSDSLYSNTIFNFEATPSYSIRVKTTDPAGAFYSQSFTITVLDANDEPTNITLSTIQVSENQSINTVIGTLSSTDQDISNTFIYTLVSGIGATDNSSFNISGNMLRTSAIFDYETKNSYSIRVKTNDGNGGFFEKVFTIDITNTNDAPTDIAISNNNFTENRAINSIVGTLTTTDQDAGNAFSYSFANVTGNDNNAFVITGSTLRSVQNFNYELKNVYYIYITSNDGNGATYTRQLQINITDSNDAPIDISLSSPSITENLPANSFIGQFSTTDQDAVSSFTYSLVSGVGSTENSYFTIRNDSIFSTGSLDFEAKSTYNIRVRSTDNGLLYTEKNFIIKVINDNDAPTNLILSNNSINENMPFNSIIGSFTSVDPDTGNTFTYSLVAGTGSNNNNLFTISGNQLKSFAIFNYEIQKTYSIRVQTNDGNGGTYSKVFTINILDINDAPTNITLSNNTITENKPVNSFIANISTSDEDTLSQFNYSFSNAQANDNSKFIIAGNQLRSNFVFDYETKQVYVVVLQTNDGNGGVFDKQFVINISDSNDAPVNITLTNNSINENESANTFIGLLSTEDPDAMQIFTYSLVAGTGSTDNQSFNISHDSLFSNSTFNYENKATYSIRIRSIDNGGLATFKTVNINIVDQNDAPVALTLSSNQLTENLPAKSIIGKFTAADADAVNNFSYTLVSGAGATDNASFSITGDQLKSNTTFNYETKNTYSIRVKVNDGRGGTFEDTFTIAITDSNDAPSDIILSTNNVAENKSIGALVANITTTDQDIADVFTYSFYDGINNNNNQFLLINNQLRTNAIFDYETKNFYLVYLTAADGKGGFITKQFIINIIDSTDAPIALNIGNNAITENQPAGTFVGILTTTDVDQLTGFNYTLVGGAGSTDNGQFKISNDSLLTNAIFHYQLKNNYSIRIRTTDNTFASYEKIISINIIDANDAPTAINLSNTNLKENSARGTIVGLLSTTDADAIDNFKYNLVTGTGSTDNTNFSIINNQLIADFSADFETKASYTIRVQTSDKENATFEQVFTINITNENEKPSIKADTFYISEGASVGTLVGTTTATDIDAAQTLNFTLLDKTDNTPFDVSVTGQITLKTKVDYETKSVYHLTVMVDDGAAKPLTDTTVIVVYIEDIVELNQSLPVSNFMSPNGDGINDYFTIANVELYKDYTLTIYNDNGLEVYKKLKEYNNDWDGTYEEKQLPNGVYFYVLKNNTTGSEFKGVINIAKP